MLYGIDRLSVGEAAEGLDIPTQEQAESNKSSRVGEGRTRSHLWIDIKTSDDLASMESGLARLLEET